MGGLVARESSEGRIVFPGQNGLWVTLAALAGVALALALFTLVADLARGTTDGTLRALLTGGGLAALLGLGAWYAAGQRREVVLDPEGLTVRAPNGKVRAVIPWREIGAIESRPLPSQRLRPAVFITRLDGTALMIDPQQVGNTEALAREARRLHANATGRAGTG